MLLVSVLLPIVQHYGENRKPASRPNGLRVSRHRRRTGQDRHKMTAIGRAEGGRATCACSASNRWANRRPRVRDVPTLNAARFNPLIKRFYDRLRAAGKPAKVARCAAARKLLQIAFAVVTKRRAFVVPSDLNG